MCIVKTTSKCHMFWKSMFSNKHCTFQIRINCQFWGPYTPLLRLVKFICLCKLDLADILVPTILRVLWLILPYAPIQLHYFVRFICLVVSDGKSHTVFTGSKFILNCYTISKNYKREPQIILFIRIICHKI